MKLVGAWFLLELAAFAYLAEVYGFLKMLGLYFFPCGLAFLFAPWLMVLTRQPQSLPSPMQLTRPVAFVALLIPSLTSRLLAVLLLTPGLRHLLVYALGKKFADWLSQKAQFSFQSGQGFAYAFSSQDLRAEEKDVTPKPALKLVASDGKALGDELEKPKL